jgi:hypothetical protein
MIKHTTSSGLKLDPTTKHTHLEQLWRQVCDCAAAAPVGDVVLAQQQLHQPKITCKG